MNTYLAIITTILVVTQLIRVIQNRVQLRRQKVLFKQQLKELADMELTERDFETQRKAYRLAVEFFEEKQKRCESCLYRSQYHNENGEYRCGGIQTENGDYEMMVQPDFCCAYYEKRGAYNERKSD